MGMVCGLFPSSVREAIPRRKPTTVFGAATVKQQAVAHHCPRAPAPPQSRICHLRIPVPHAVLILTFQLCQGFPCSRMSGIETERSLKRLPRLGFPVESQVSLAEPVIHIFEGWIAIA